MQYKYIEIQINYTINTLQIHCNTINYNKNTLKMHYNTNTIQIHYNTNVERSLFKNKMAMKTLDFEINDFLSSTLR